jgi:hypothetical protein
VRRQINADCVIIRLSADCVITRLSTDYTDLPVNPFFYPYNPRTLFTSIHSYAILSVIMTLTKQFPPDWRVRLDVPLEKRRTGRETGWSAAFPLAPGETVKPLYGLFESDGHELDRFLEDKRREKTLEDGTGAFSEGTEAPETSEPIYL